MQTPLTLINSTLSNNSASYGDGITTQYGAVTASNSIIANSGKGGDCYISFGRSMRRTA